MFRNQSVVGCEGTKLSAKELDCIPSLFWFNPLRLKKEFLKDKIESIETGPCLYLYQILSQKRYDIELKNNEGKNFSIKVQIQIG